MNNITGKHLLTDLFEFFVSLPDSKEKRQLNQIISMIKSGSDLKIILLKIQGNIDKQRLPKGSDITIREKNIKFWEFVLSLFTKHLRS